MTNILNQETTLADWKSLVGISLEGNSSNVSRELLTSVLELVVCNHDSRKCYLTELYLQVVSGQKFRKNPLNDSILDSIREHRFAEIDNDVLLSIAGSCLAICQICEEVIEDVPQEWEPIFLKIGEFIVHKVSENELADALDSESPSPSDDELRPSVRPDEVVSKSREAEFGLALGGTQEEIDEDEEEDADDED